MPGGLRFVVSTEPTAPITPLPVPAGVTRVMLFGGSFDPPHRAHVELAARARDEVLGKDAWLVFVPAARSPHKEAGPSASDEDRIAMLGLATREVPNSAVWTDEIDRAAGQGDASASFTVDTVRRLCEIRPDLCRSRTSVRLLMGSDQAASFWKWRAPREILGLCEPTVLLRAPQGTMESFLSSVREAGFWNDEELDDWHRRVLLLPLRPESSTQVRGGFGGSMIRDLPVDDAVNPDVLAYIREHGLYVR